MSEALRDPLSAADPASSAWLSANAGAGKTHTLADRVSRLLLDGADPAKILCLTYTKAAAAEMMRRLFEERLGTWTMLDDASLSGKLAEIGARPRDREGLREARRLFAKALETPGGLKIQTIHSFCQNLLSRFPLEAGIAPSFEVLSEQETRDLIGEARTRVLERAGSGDKKLAAAVSYLVTQTSEARLRDVLDAALLADRRKLERFFAGLPDAEDALATAIHDAHGTDRRETYERIASEFCENARREEARLKDVAAWLSGGAKGDRERAAILRQALIRSDPAGFFETLCDAFLTTKGQPVQRVATKSLEKADPGLFAFFSAFAARALEAERRCRVARAAALAEAVLFIAREVCGEYERAKRLRGMLDYDDLVQRTLDLLSRRDAAAWVLYKLDGGLDHILIDEAQDTSPEQWEIVRKLSEEFFAGEGRAAGKMRTVFAVGDEKQSIFSFQGADPLEFHANQRHFAEEAAKVMHRFAAVRLLRSRRSAPEILKFVDLVFEDAEAREGLTSEDIPIEHQVHREAARGRVELWPTIAPADTPDHHPWEMPVDFRTEDSPVSLLAQQIAREIARWTDGKTYLPGDGKPVGCGDIMILMPRREPFASEMIRRLKEHNIPVAGADRLRLKDQIGVMDLLALAKFAVLPEDDMNLAELLRSPLCGVTGEQLEELCVARKASLWGELVRRQADLEFAAICDFLRETLRRADFAPPYEFFAHALSARGLRAKLLARLGPEANDAVDEFLSLALEFEAHGTPSLQGFIHWVERGDATIKRDMERSRDEVRVMTVHGAKGLEAKIVILPDTTTLPEPPGKHGELIYGRDLIVYPLAEDVAPDLVQQAKLEARAEAMRERRRLLYVALTRARDRLVICGFENRHGLKPGSWYDLCQRAMSKAGHPVRRGDMTIQVLGDADFETGTDARETGRENIEIPAWARTAPKPERRSVRVIHPSEAAGLESPPTFSPTGDGRQRFRRGVLIHALLAGLPETDPAERRTRAVAYLAARGMSEAEARATADSVIAIIESGDFAAAFAPGARAELAIAAALPELGEHARISGRIDRLAVTDNEVLAVDFKTNRPPPARVEDVGELYIAQMALYRAALAKVFPARRIACALLWTETPQLMHLPDALLDAEILKIRARLGSP